MRILQWAFPYFPAVGGRERFIQRLIDGLSENGHEVSLVMAEPSAKNGTAPEVNGLDVFYINPYLEIFPGRKVQADFQMDHLIKFVSDRKIELIHFHNTSGTDVRILQRLKDALGIPVVLTLHGPLGLDWKGRINPAPPDNLVDTYVSISKFVHQASLDFLGSTEVDMNLVPNGVPIGPPSSSDIGRGFLYFGRISGEKGIPQLLAAFKLFTSLGHDTHLRIVGDGPDRAFVETVSVLLGIDDRVFFINWLDVDELSAEIAASRAVVVPSIWQEPFGLVAVEAMSQSRPVIYSRVGALPEILGPDGTSGIGFESGDIARLVSAMVELHLKPEMAKQMGITGRARVQKHYDFSRMLADYEGVFSKVVGLGGL